MKLFTSKMLERLMSEQKKKSEGLLPEIVKRLIQSKCSDLSYLRVPDGDDIWAPGYDGIVVNETKTTYVAQGKSVWEFGTNSDSLEKINGDYKKRTTHPLGVEKSDTTFYLVVPKVWAYRISTTEWEAEHREEWKAVHVYDASVLCDWLNSEPAVCAWIMQSYLENELIKIDTVDRAWERFSRRTNPPLGHGIFQIGRETQIEDFQKKANGNLCLVVAESRMEAYGFCLSALLKNPELADKVTVLYDEITYQQLDTICENASFLLLFPYEGQISEKNCTILCEGKGVARENSVKLLPRWKTQYLQALQEMGISSVDAEELYSYTHGNLSALIRKIPGNGANIQPEWMNVADIDLLQPLVLLRHYDNSDEEEQNLISRLAGTPYPVVERKYEALLRMDDSPIQKIDKWYQIVNDEESWLALKMDIESAVGQRMHREICTALSCTDETQNRRRYGVLQRLLRNYACFAETGSNQNVIDSRVSEILSFFHVEGCRECLTRELRTLSEAAPMVVLEFLQCEQLDCENDILWTMDVLVEREDTSRQACWMLYQMAVSGTQNEHRRVETAKKHLLDALCLWSSHTALRSQDKKTLMIQMLRETPAFGVGFGIELLKKDSLIRGHHRGKKGKSDPLISEQELFDCYDEITRMVYETALKNKWLEQIEKILKEYRRLGEDILLEMAKRFDAAQFSSTALRPINYWLRTELYDDKKYDCIDWIKVLETWLHCTEPNDPVDKFGWMFSNWYRPPMEELLNDEDEGWKKKADHAEELRTTKFVELKTTYGMDAVRQLLEMMEDQYLWGMFLAGNSADKEFETLTESICVQRKLQVLAGFFDYGNFQIVADVFEKLSEAEKLQLLPLLRREEVEQWLTTPQRKRTYWEKRSMTAYSEKEYQQLLKYHPGGLLPYLYDQRKQIENLLDRFKEVFEAIAEQGLAPEDTGYLSELVNEMDQQFYSDEWARCCLLLYKRKRLQNFPQCLQRYLFYSPEEMKNLLNENASFRGYAYYYYTLPKDAFRDKEIFERWCECLVRESMEILGRILGRGENGEDGAFPHEFVRAFLEAQQNEKLTVDVAYGKINSRGARIVLDGRELYEEAEHYRVQARELEWSFPQSALILRKLAEWLESESRYDRIEAEIVQ